MAHESFVQDKVERTQKLYALAAPNYAAVIESYQKARAVATATIAKGDRNESN
jgi:hypothetical protein